MAEQPECGTNRTYLIDFIPFTSCAKLINIEVIRDLHVHQELSISQIAAKLGFSKTTIFSAIKRFHLQVGVQKGRNIRPDNYRSALVPYGYKVQDGKLVIAKSELKVCKAVVELLRNGKTSLKAAAHELNRRGYKNRRGKIAWRPDSVQRIFKRWKDKL